MCVYALDIDTDICSRPLQVGMSRAEVLVFLAANYRTCGAHVRVKINPNPNLTLNPLGLTLTP